MCAFWQTRRIAQDTGSENPHALIPLSVSGYGLPLRSGLKAQKCILSDIGPIHEASAETKAANSRAVMIRVDLWLASTSNPLLSPVTR